MFPRFLRFDFGIYNISMWKYPNVIWSNVVKSCCQVVGHFNPNLQWTCVVHEAREAEGSHDQAPEAARTTRMDRNDLRLQDYLGCYFIVMTKTLSNGHDVY